MSEKDYSSFMPNNKTEQISNSEKEDITDIQVEEQISPSAQQLRNRHKKRKKSKKIKTISIVFVCLVLVAGACFGGYSYYLKNASIYGGKTPEKAASDYVEGKFNLDAEKYCNVLDVPMKKMLVHDLGTNADMGFETNVNPENSDEFEQMYSKYFEFCELNNTMNACIILDKVSVTSVDIVSPGESKYTKFVKYAFDAGYDDSGITHMAKVKIKYTYKYTSDVSDTGKIHKENKDLYCAERDGRWYVSYDG